MGCSLKNRGLVFWGGLKRIVHTKKKSKKFALPSAPLFSSFPLSDHLVLLSSPSHPVLSSTPPPCNSHPVLSSIPPPAIPIHSPPITHLFPFHAMYHLPGIEPPTSRSLDCLLFHCTTTTPVGNFTIFLIDMLSRYQVTSAKF